LFGTGGRRRGGGGREEEGRWGGGEEEGEEDEVEPKEVAFWVLIHAQTLILNI
jgi:hypothetical protein